MRDVGGVAEAVVVLVAGAVVAVVAAAQADARGPGAERLDAEEEVGEAQAVDAVVPAAQVRGHRAAPGLADVAHVVLVVQVQAGEAEVDALGASEVDDEAVRAAAAVERAATAEDVVGRVEEVEEGTEEVAAHEALEGLPLALALAQSVGDVAAAADALGQGVVALPAAGAGQCNRASSWDMGPGIALLSLSPVPIPVLETEQKRLLR